MPYSGNGANTCVCYQYAGIINVFRPKKTLKNRIKLYSTLALPTWLYDSENRCSKVRDATRISASEKKYMRTAGYTWRDHKTNTEIAKESNVTPVLDKMQRYKRNWIQHVNRMTRNRLPRLIKTTTQKAGVSKEDH
jgi:hypothetical protein